jgi:hypothetical protein
MPAIFPGRQVGRVVGEHRRHLVGRIVGEPLEGKPAHSTRPLEGEVERDFGAGPVPEQVHPLEPEAIERLGECERVITDSGQRSANTRRFTKAGVVERDHGVVTRQRTDDRLHRGRAAGTGVEHDHGRPLACPPSMNASVANVEIVPGDHRLTLRLAQAERAERLAVITPGRPSLPDSQAVEPPQRATRPQSGQ